MKICNHAGARAIGKPREWDETLDGPCGTIYVTDHIDILTGANVMYSCYKLSDDEIEALKNGGMLRLGIMGNVHPVFQLGVLGPKITGAIQPTPMSDLGGVIEHG